MNRRLSTLRLLLAVTAWLAQLCVPVVHAASMAASDAGAAAWCGQTSPAMRAKLAQLPAEVRQILEDGAAHAGQVEACKQLCAASTTPIVDATVPMPVALRLAGLDILPRPATPAVVPPRDSRPPPRGPPLHA